MARRRKLWLSIPISITEFRVTTFTQLQKSLWLVFKGFHLHICVTFSTEKGGGGTRWLICNSASLRWSWHDWEWHVRAATAALTVDYKFLKVLEKRLSEVWSDKAVDDEVDWAVEHHKVSDDVVCDPPWGWHIVQAAIAVTVKDVWNRGDLPKSLYSWKWVWNLIYLI